MESPRTALPNDLGDMLVEARMLTEEKLRHIRELQAKDGDKIEHLLLQERLIRMSADRKLQLAEAA